MIKLVRMTKLFVVHDWFRLFRLDFYPLIFLTTKSSRRIGIISGASEGLLTMGYRECELIFSRLIQFLENNVLYDLGLHMINLHALLDRP